MATQVEARTSVQPGAHVAEMRRTVPHADELPLAGSLRNFNRDRLGFVQGLARSYGDISRFHFGPFPVAFFNSSELMHSLLVEHANDFDTGVVRRNAFQPILGNGLFVSEGELHRRQRKAMAPAFQPRHIKAYADTMVHYAELAQAQWADGQQVGINAEMIHITMSIVGKVLFDADVFTESDELGASITVALEHANYVFSRVVSIPITWPIPRHRRTRRALAFLRGRIQQMIDDRRRNGEERDDFLSILLRTRDEDGNPMSDEQISDEAVTFFGAGHETTATALTWAWYLLAKHPEVSARLRDEAASVLGGRPPTYNDLTRLPYALQVFKETMRLYPPAYLLSRVALHDVEVGGYLIKRGTTVMLSPYAIHRRPDYFLDPTRFDPERFTPEREAALPRYAYMPFGAGPRICIGNHFALMEGHLLLADLAQRVRFELVPGQHIVPNPMVTTRPRGDIQMIVRRV